jgi:DNA polymerase-3 subunit epsilon
MYSISFSRYEGRKVNADDAYLIEKGRQPYEDAFVLLKDSRCLGHGFIDKGETINSHDDLENYLIPQKGNAHIKKILRPRLFTF